MNQYCFICNDVHHYRNTVLQVQNIYYRLHAMVKHSIPYTREMQQFKNSLVFDRKHVHMMCGYCSRINEMELRNLEEKIDDTITQLVFQTKEDNKYEILRVLQGVYPGKYHQVERYYRGGKKKC